MTLLALLGLALGVGRVARVPHAQAFFLTTAFVILALYLGALAGALWWMALAVHITGVALLGLEALQRARQPARIAIPVPLGVLVLLCAWFSFVHGADRYVGYDEYAHWGIFIKEMLALDGFWTADTNSLHPRYPPGSPLWQYLFNAFLPYSEGRTYFAHFVLLLAPLLMLWNNVRWSQPAWLLAILALVLLAIANFGPGVSTLYVDQTIGVWYLGTLLAAFTDENLASRRALLYAAPITVIALLKDAGFGFAVSAAVIVAALFFQRARTLERPHFPWPKTGAALVAVLAPALLCLLVWSWNRDAVGAGHDTYSVAGIVDGIADHSGAANAEIRRRLTEVFFDQQIGNSQVSYQVNEFTYGIRAAYTDSFRLTTFSLLVALPIWWAAIAASVLTGESRRRWLIVAGGALVTALAYLVVLHASYRFAFGERGLDLPSYVRYVNVIALPLLLLSACPLLPGFGGPEGNRVWRFRHWRIPQRATVFVVAVLVLYFTETPYLRTIVEPHPESPGRTALEGVVAEIRRQVGNSRLWIYYTGDSPQGALSRIALYLLSPTPAVVEQSERFLHANDTRSIATVWSVFDYVWIASPLTPESAAGFARFDAGEATMGLFRVHALGGDKVVLEPLRELDSADQSTALDHQPL
jgi:hypothetical protein